MEDAQHDRWQRLIWDVTKMLCRTVLTVAMTRRNILPADENLLTAEVRRVDERCRG